MKKSFESNVFQVFVSLDFGDKNQTYTTRESEDRKRVSLKRFFQFECIDH